MFPSGICFQVVCGTRYLNVKEFIKTHNNLNVWEITRGIKFWQRVAGPHMESLGIAWKHLEGMAAPLKHTG